MNMVSKENQYRENDRNTENIKHTIKQIFKTENERTHILSYIVLIVHNYDCADIQCSLFGS